MKNLLTSLCLCFCVGIQAQVPILNSSPTATAVLFLDFDGHTVNSSVWNNGNTLICSNPNLPTAMMAEAFNRVAEDYKIFKVNVTTDSTVFLAAPLSQRTRVIITSTNFVGAGTAGVAYVGSISWGDDTPAFVFADAGATPKFIGEACSHEAGHTLGCAHQSIYDMYCNKLDEYNSGQGSGAIAWAPIMGNSVNRTFSIWHDGKRSTSCDNQDDVSIIANRITGGGLWSDDITNTYTNALAIKTTGITIKDTGVIGNSSDIDFFKLQINEPTVVKLNVTPPTNTINETIGNVDVLAKLYNGLGVLIKSYNYADSLNARIDTTLNQGTYYVSVQGTNNVNTPSAYGSAGAYLLMGSIQTVQSLPIHHIGIRASINNNNHVINYTISADEAIAKMVIEYSIDGVSFSTLQQVDYRASSYSYMPFSTSTIYYRIKAMAVSGSTKISAIVSLQSNKSNNTLQIQNNKVNDLLLITVTENCNYQLLDVSGKAVAKGVLLTNNLNKINIAHLTNGMYILKANTRNATAAQKIIKE